MTGCGGIGRWEGDGVVVSWWVYIYLFLIRGYIFNWVGVNEKKKEEKKQGINVSKTECGRGATVQGDGKGGVGSACFGWVWAWVVIVPL